eukprot:NODE_2042_length_662_cov_208.014682_g1598_i0.p2 GENE.NODE_2042_length_662_cov_208.014682_g1598_i0~~NODE_2042_length_662_cov_208.014682_g1598_i0.p2  ORF type:complete len:53 (-),score=5.77 NODE_2042_length_662_cov_208.014682_g1598_i0:101-259(-)
MAVRTRYKVWIFVAIVCAELTCGFVCSKLAVSYIGWTARRRVLPPPPPPLDV